MHTDKRPYISNAPIIQLIYDPMWIIITRMEHTIFGLIEKRSEIAGQNKIVQKAADALKTDLNAIDRARVLRG